MSARHTTCLSTAYADLDEGIAACSELVALNVLGCPAEPTFPAALLQLTQLRTLSIRAAHGVVVRVPELVARLPLTALWLENVDVDALVLPPTLQDLSVSSQDAVNDATPLQQKLSSSSVRVLRLVAEGKSRTQRAPVGWSSIPSLRSLTLSLFQPGAPDLTGTSLDRLELCLSSLQELKQIAATCGSTLKSLMVWADGGDVPEEIGAFAQLESLTVHAPVKTLPSSVSQLCKLTQFTLSNLPTRHLPDAIAMLPALEQLDISAQLNALPASLAQLSTLKRLSLVGVLNNGAMLSQRSDVTKMSPLPAVLSSLTSLEELDLSQCGVVDAAPLRSLQKLRVLKLAWSGISTLDDVAALSSLEELDLDSAARVRDLTPLKHLQQLRVLIISNTHPQSLDVLKLLPSLKVLNIESIARTSIRAVFDLDVDLKADDEVCQRFNARQQLRRLPPIRSIIERLQHDDVNAVALALDQLASWVLASSTHHTNAIESALNESESANEDGFDEGFDDDVLDDEDEAHDQKDDDEDDDEEEDNDDERPARRGSVRWDVLASCVERHIDALPTSVLAKLFSALFQQMHDDTPTACRIADEVVRRGDDDDQRILAAAFAKASAHADPRHRSHAGVRHLVDRVLPALRQPALVELLTACSVAQFVDDAMLDLWRPALARATAADLRMLRPNFEALAQHLTPATVWALAPVGSLAATHLVEPVRARLTAASQRTADIATFSQLCSSTGTLHEGLQQLLALDDKQLRSVASTCWARLQRHTVDFICTGLAYRTEQDLVDLGTLFRRTDDIVHRRELLLTLAGLGPAVATRLLQQAGYASDLLASLVRRAIVDTITALEGRRRLRRDSSSSTALLTDDGVVALRAWATSLDGLDGGAAASAELLHAVELLGNSDMAPLRVTIGLLAECDPPAGGFALDRVAHALAGDVGIWVKDPREWPFFCVFAHHLHKLVLTGRSLERILAQLLGVSITSADNVAVRCVLQKVPPVVEWDILAYNLACHFAVAGDRDGVLSWAKRSLELGKSPAQFAADHDFDAFRSDPAFVAVMSSTS